MELTLFTLPTLTYSWLRNSHGTSLPLHAGRELDALFVSKRNFGSLKLAPRKFQPIFQRKFPPTICRIPDIKRYEVNFSMNSLAWKVALTSVFVQWATIAVAQSSYDLRSPDQ